MRIDARNLLDKLGRNDFAYREFEDRFSELELWPILEALLRDPRLQALDLHEAATRSEPAQQPETQSSAAPADDNFGSMFSRYDRDASFAKEKDDRRDNGQQQDVRAMLRHLSDLGSRGEI